MQGTLDLLLNEGISDLTHDLPAVVDVDRHLRHIGELVDLRLTQRY